MKAKDKATEIFWLMYGQINGDTDDNLCIASARSCAKITIEQIINLDDFSAEGRTYWMEVNIELERL